MHLATNITILAATGPQGRPIISIGQIVFLFFAAFFVTLVVVVLVQVVRLLVHRAKAQKRASMKAGKPAGQPDTIAQPKGDAAESDSSIESG